MTTLPNRVRRLPIATAGPLLLIVLAACGPAAPDGSPGSAEPTPLPAVAIGPAVCENNDIGLRIEVPDGWWYSAAVAPCLSLNAEEFSMQGTEPDRPVGIQIRVIEGDVGSTEDPISREEGEIDGFPYVATQVEVQGSGGVLPVGTRIYRYTVQLGAVSEVGPNLTFSTTSQSPGYEENAAALDALMETVRIVRP